MDERIPYLTVAERAELFGQSFGDQLELERREQWCRSWAARFGAGAERLRAWLAAGRPRVDRAALAVVGDRPIVAAVRDVLAALPEAVAHFLVGNVVVVCSGVETDGWCGALPTLPCDAPQLIALTCTEPALVCHEICHGWHRRDPSPARLSAEQAEAFHENVCAFAVEEGLVEELLARQLQRERAADALATALGFPIDSTRGMCGEPRRRHLLQGIHRAAERARSNLKETPTMHTEGRADGTRHAPPAAPLTQRLRVR